MTIWWCEEHGDVGNEDRCMWQSLPDEPCQMVQMKLVPLTPGYITEIEYRQLPGSDVWHLHPRCQHWRRTWLATVQAEKPTTGEFCTECLAKAKREWVWV